MCCCVKQSGLYLLDPETIRSDYQVDHPALPKADIPFLYGDYIADACSNHTSYT